MQLLYVKEWTQQNTKKYVLGPNVLSKNILNKTLSILIKESAPEVKSIQSILKVKAIPFSGNIMVMNNNAIL